MRLLHLLTSLPPVKPDLPLGLESNLISATLGVTAGAGQIAASLTTVGTSPAVAASLALGAVAFGLSQALYPPPHSHPTAPQHPSPWGDDNLDDDDLELPMHLNNRSIDLQRQQQVQKRTAAAVLSAPALALTNAMSRVQQAATAAPAHIWQQAWNCLEKQQQPMHNPHPAGTPALGTRHVSGTPSASHAEYREGLQPAGSHRLALQGLDARARLHLVALSLTSLEERVTALPEQAGKYVSLSVLLLPLYCCQAPYQETLCL